MSQMTSPALIINIQVDSLSLLSGAPLAECVFMVDTSDLTQGKGSASLHSVALPGQRVRWTITSIDLQAPAQLERIVFVDHDDADSLHAFRESDPHPEGQAVKAVPGSVEWEGFVPPAAIAGLAYPYHIHLSFGGGSGVPVLLTGSSLEVQPTVFDDVYSTPGAAWASDAFLSAGGVL